MACKNVIIVGAAGRDFHNFLSYWRYQPNVNVVCFTANQIPGITDRVFPAELAGPKYPKGIPIRSESELEQLIYAFNVDTCCLSYSDLSYNYVMSMSSRVNAAGAHFSLLSPHHTMLKSTKPVIAVTAVRTGCGKSATSRYMCGLIRELGLKPVVLRHPMPYGDLVEQRVQRYENFGDMKRHKCTIEEMEEYELHIEEGNLLFAGVDYESILREAEKEADVIVWDGGNNDASFIAADLYICVADALRVGHECSFYPGETNVRLANVVLMNKANSASAENLKTLEANIRKINTETTIMRSDSSIVPQWRDRVDSKDHERAEKLLKGARVLVIDDGPTLTHGGMPFGAGYALAKKVGAICVDPRPFAKGSLRDVFTNYTHIKECLPAMGYGDVQMQELSDTIAACPCDIVVVGTPIDLGKHIRVDKPVVRARYSMELSSDSRAELVADVQKALASYRQKMRRAPQ